MQRILLAGSTVWLGLVASSVPALAQRDLELSLVSDRTEFEFGEPVVLFVSLTNRGSTASGAMRFLQPDYGFVEYIVRDPEGTEQTFVPLGLNEHAAPQMTLAPGESLIAEAKLFFGGRGWTFASPGRYQVQAVYLGEVSSNRREVTVRAPTEEASRRAAELFLQSEEVGRFLVFEGGDHLSDGMGRLEEVASTLPATPHATYANYALGVNLLHDFANFTQNRLREAQPVRAIEYLEAARARSVGFYDTMHSLRSLAEAYRAITDSERAESVEGELLRRTAEEFPAFGPLLAAVIRTMPPHEGHYP